MPIQPEDHPAVSGTFHQTIPDCAIHSEPGVEMFVGLLRRTMVILLRSTIDQTITTHSSEESKAISEMSNIAFSSKRR